MWTYIIMRFLDSPALNSLLGMVECKRLKAFWGLKEKPLNNVLLGIEWLTPPSLASPSLSLSFSPCLFSVRPWSWSWKRSGSSLSMNRFPRRGQTVFSPQQLCLKTQSATVSVTSFRTKRIGSSLYQTRRTTRATSMPHISRYTRGGREWKCKRNETHLAPERRIYVLHNHQWTV